MTTVGDVYRLGRSLGSGNQGIVRRATRKDGTGTAVAVKLLQLPPDEDRARFRREIALMAENPHENVVPVLESGEEGDGALWYAMPLARSSFAWHLVQGRLDRETIDEVLAQICAGVGHLHAHGIVHRDLYSSQVQAETYNFAFTDEIADFMHRAVQMTGDPSILGSAIAACAVIGQSHNRWHVQEVFKRLVGSVRSSEHALAACEALDQVPDNALAWSVAGFDLDGLHPTIAAAVAKRIGDGSPTAL